MRSAIAPLVLALAVLAGCGDSEAPSTSAPAATSTSAPAPTTPAPATAQATDALGGATATTPSGKPSPYVVVTSLLGRPLPNEPGCTFAKAFVPAKSATGGYDGQLKLAVTCPRSDKYTPVGLVVNGAGNKPTEISCPDADKKGQLFCIYAPSTSVGLLFTGTDRAVVRRRLERLIEVVSPLPTGVTPVPAP